MKRSTFLTWSDLKVGALILAALAIMTFGMYKLGQAANLFTKRYELVTFLPNANGLRVGGAVAISGQPVGTVKEIKFLNVDADTLRNLRIVVEIDESMKEQVREDSRARVRTMGLLGDKMIDISSGTPRYAVLTPNDTIQVAQALDYEQVIAQAAGAVDDMVALTHDLKTLTGGMVRGEGTMGQLLTNRSMYDELTGTLGRMNNMLGRLQNPNGMFGKMMDDPKMYDNMVAVMARLDTVLTAVASEEGSMGKLMRDTTLYANLVGISSSADSLMKLMTTGEGFAAKMLKDDKLYDQLNKAVTDLNAILEDVRKNPGKYTKGMIKVF
jgi:phospholipid/cholesterol/gamma-HCH transport system substrate-binding protein